MNKTIKWVLGVVVFAILLKVFLDWWEQIGAMKERNRRYEEDRRLEYERQLWEAKQAAKTSAATLAAPTALGPFLAALGSGAWHLVKSHWHNLFH